MNLETFSTGNFVKPGDIMQRVKEMEKAYHNAADLAYSEKPVHYFRS
jgi:hypothetical protein